MRTSATWFTAVCGAAARNTRSIDAMGYKEAAEKLAAYRRQIADLRKKMRETQAAVEPEEVRDYAFATPQGTVQLSALFGGKADLIVIHNMGSSCPYCTLWADGFNGIYDHLASRVAFVVSSPDRPDVQKKFAAGRGWRFPMVSHADTAFAADMGYGSASGGWRPGITVFRKDGNRILRVSDAATSPGDGFCALWHIFDLLPDGAAGWEPKYRYP
jgi:predicted dithiol-disulfide oxidoreductase (DUF899 family)